MNSNCSSPPSSSSAALDMKTSSASGINSNKAVVVGEMQKIKKCALITKTVKSKTKTFSKISQKCVKNLRKATNLSINPRTMAQKVQRINKNQPNIGKAASLAAPKTSMLNSSRIGGRRQALQPRQRTAQPAGRRKAAEFLEPATFKTLKSKTLKHSKALSRVEPPPQQLLHLITKENFLLTLDLLAVVRRNASDKLKLIQMVHDNPILWDSRLPNFKGAEEEKNSAWEQIGREFNAPGRRVARAFKSLRESYRRELAHVKLMGNGFKPKWSLYDAMDFLRDVIRERK